MRARPNAVVGLDVNEHFFQKELALKVVTKAGYDRSLTFLGMLMTDVTIFTGEVRLAASVSGSADHPPVMFLHGISNSRDTWEEIAAELSNEFRVWTLDFRGHGHSDRTATYGLDGWRADAEALLATIGRPTAIVGHSLGGCIAGMLAQDPHPLVRGVFLEDPGWYLWEPGEWDKVSFAKLFPIVAAKQAAWQSSNAALSEYLEFASNAPSPLGGVNSDHTSPRHLLSWASALQRQDNRCWFVTTEEGRVPPFDAAKEFKCPTWVVRGDPQLGSALLEGHDAWLTKTNPGARMLHYAGCGHNIHRTNGFDARFLRDLRTFLASLQAP